MVGDRGRQLDRRREDGAVVDDAIHQSHRQGLVGIDRTAGQDQVESPALTDEAWEANSPSIYLRYTYSPVEHSEHCAAGRDSQITPDRELKAASYGVALDRGDHRLAGSGSCGAHGAGTVSADVGHPPAGNGFEIETCTKRAPRTS